MRIIAGKYAKRNLHTLKSNATRPTSDKVKGSLFNSLGQFFDGGQVLDLYAGSGALGIEAVSRGYDGAVLVDIFQVICILLFSYFIKRDKRIKSNIGAILFFEMVDLLTTIGVEIISLFFGINVGRAASRA